MLSPVKAKQTSTAARIRSQYTSPFTSFAGRWLDDRHEESRFFFLHLSLSFVWFAFDASVPTATGQRNKAFTKHIIIQKAEKKLFQ